MKNREEIAQALAAAGYIADGELATAISLMQLLRRPLLLEGEAGVGKTEVAKALASAHATELIRLQCYEGLDQSAELYEWNYQRQLLAIQAHRGDKADRIEDQIFSEKYLLERPLLAAKACAISSRSLIAISSRSFIVTRTLPNSWPPASCSSSRAASGCGWTLRTRRRR